MPSVTTSSVAPATFTLFAIVLASLVTIGLGSIPTCICPRGPIYVPLNRPTTVFVSAFSNNSLVFATTSLPIFASNFTTKTGPVVTGSILPSTVNVSLTLTPLIASNGSITVSFTDAATGSASCTITYIGYSGPTCSVLQTKLLVSVGEVFTATIIGFSPNSQLTAKASNLPAHTNGTIITNTTMVNSIVVITAVPGVPATEIINVQFFDQYGFNTTCSVSYTVVVASTTNAPTAAPTTPAPTTTPSPPPTDYTTYTDYYPTYTTSPPTQAPTTQPPKPTTANTPVCNAPASPVYLPIGLPTTIQVSVYGKHPLVVTTVNLPSFAQLSNGTATILSGASLSASANVSVILRPILAVNGTFSVVFSDVTDTLNGISSCAIQYITYTGPTCISVRARILANTNGNQDSAYVAGIVGFSPISSLTVTTRNLPVGVSVAINNTLAPVAYIAAVSRTNALNTSATVYANFMDSYGFNATCFLNITVVANASLVIPPTQQPTVSPTSAPTTTVPTTQKVASAVPTTSVVTNAPLQTTAAPTISVTTQQATTVPVGTSAAGTTASPSTVTPAPTSTVPVVTTSVPTTSVPSAPASTSAPVTVTSTSAPTVMTTAAPTSVTTPAPVTVATTAAPSTTLAPTTAVTSTASPTIVTTSAPATLLPTLQPTEIVVIPTQTIAVTIPSTIVPVIPTATLAPVVLPPVSICPASVHLVVGVTTTVSVRVQASALVSLQAQSVPSFALFSNSNGSIALGSTFNADENVTITFAPRASLDGSLVLVFVDQLTHLNTTCSIAYDVYSGPSCTVSQTTYSVVVGSLFTATVSGVSSESSLAISTSSASTDFKLSTQNDVVTVVASPLSAKNESVSVTFTDKYGLNATCTVSWDAAKDIVLPHNVAPTMGLNVFVAFVALLVVVLL